MITLPDRPLSFQDIIKCVRKLKINHFRTVFSRDNLPKKHIYEDSEIALLCLQTLNLFPNINSTINRLEIDVFPSKSNRLILKYLNLF